MADAHGSRGAGQGETMKIRPFSNASEYEYWIARNCYICQASQKCEIEAALLQASVGDGAIDIAMWRRMGNKDDDIYPGPCPEFELSDQKYKEAREQYEVEEE